MLLYGAMSSQGLNVLGMAVPPRSITIVGEFESCKGIELTEDTSEFEEVGNMLWGRYLIQISEGAVGGN